MLQEMHAGLSLLLFLLNLWHASTMRRRGGLAPRRHPKNFFLTWDGCIMVIFGIDSMVSFRRRYNINEFSNTDIILSMIKILVIVNWSYTEHRIMSYRYK